MLELRTVGLALAAGQDNQLPMDNGLLQIFYWFTCVPAPHT